MRRLYKTSCLRFWNWPFARTVSYHAVRRISSLDSATLAQMRHGGKQRATGHFSRTIRHGTQISKPSPALLPSWIRLFVFSPASAPKVRMPSEAHMVRAAAESLLALLCTREQVNSSMNLSRLGPTMLIAGWPTTRGPSRGWKRRVARHHSVTRASAGGLSRATIPRRGSGSTSSQLVAGR